jgi:HEAT repeat protein
MKSKTATRISRRILAVVVLSLVVWLGFHELLRHGCFALRIQPHFEGKPLEYWCRYGFGNNPTEQPSKADVNEALQSMKNGAIPFLVKWIGTMNHSSQGTDYESLALHAFEILGTNASPAIPGLIKVIGRNNNWQSSALGHIGPAAVPALIELLTTNQSPDTFGDWRRGIPDNTVREHAIEALTYSWTNAQAALPLLMACYKDEESRSRANMASALASVGHNRPEIVVPAIVYLFTNSSRMSKYEAPEALATFGSAAKPAIPVLLEASQTADAQTKARIAVAIKQIEPERPDTLLPLIANLTSDSDVLRNYANMELDLLGTNALEVLGAMRTMAVQVPDPRQRSGILGWLAKYETNKEELLRIVQVNLTNENDLVVAAAIGCLGGLACDSQARFGELLAEFESQRNEQMRENVRTRLYLAMTKHPEFLKACLNNTQNEVSYSALRFMQSLSRDTLVIDRKAPEPSTNFQAYAMKDIDDGDKKLLQDSIPILMERLHDGHLETRQLATNVLLELDPKAAKKAGVIVVPPYSLFSN